jgi:4-hydroxybenzoate polyprenyltransferase
MNPFLSSIKLPSYLKNLLVFVPLLISSSSITFSNILNSFFGLIFFSFCSFVIYTSNDYIDRKKDKLNILKKKNIFIKKFNKKKILFLNIILLFIIFFSYYYSFLFGWSLLAYVLLNYLYNFFTKKTKYLDLFFLTIFHLLRLFYGCEINSLEISYIFIIYFMNFFLMLAIIKRSIQIYMNKLIINNSIISYSMKDLWFLKITNYFLFFLNFLIFLIYLNKDFYGYGKFINSNNTIIIDNLFFYYFSFFVYALVSLFMLRLFKLTNERVIKTDIMVFVSRDTFSLAVGLFLATIFILLKLWHII